MFKKFLLSVSVLVCSITALKAVPPAKMEVCEGTQFILKEMIAGREQAMKGKAMAEDPSQFNSNVLFSGWEGVGISEPPSGFRFIFYQQGKDVKTLEPMFAAMKSAFQNCPLADGPLPVTTDVAGHFEFAISGVSVMLRLLPPNAEMSANLILLISKTPAK